MQFDRQPVLTPSRRVDDIPIGEFAHGEDVLFTSGIGSGLVLAAHNRETSEGLLGHFGSLTDQTAELPANQTAFMNAMIELVELGPPRETYVWMGGTAPLTERGYDPAKCDRDFAVGYLRGLRQAHSFAPETFSTDWLKPKTAINVTLACDMGMLAVARYNY